MDVWEIESVAVVPQDLKNGMQGCFSVVEDTVLSDGVSIIRTRRRRTCPAKSVCEVFQVGQVHVTARCWLLLLLLQDASLKKYKVFSRFKLPDCM